jgi:hypothetical protein
VKPLDGRLSVRELVELRLDLFAFGRFDLLPFDTHAAEDVQPPRQSSDDWRGGTA